MGQNADFCNDSKAYFLNNMLFLIDFNISLFLMYLKFNISQATTIGLKLNLASLFGKR